MRWPAPHTGSKTTVGAAMDGSGRGEKVRCLDVETASDGRALSSTVGGCRSFQHHGKRDFHPLNSCVRDTAGLHE